MKIYKLPVDEILKPRVGFRAPAHNQDYGVEQDFEQFLVTHSEYLADNSKEADFYYLPIYWNRYYCNHWGNKTDILQAEILRLVSRNIPTFTICEYDIATMQPQLDLCNMTIFTASRHSDNGCIDIPLLCSKHKELPYKENRKWLASFMGKFETHGLREEMREALQGREDVYLSESQDTQAYIELMADSYIALAPRGYGGQSFRLYEAMQFGCVPMLISDVDVRPFKKWIDWDRYSFYAKDMDTACGLVGTFSLALLKDTIVNNVGIMTKQLWQDELHYGKWCKYVFRELATL